VVRLTPLVLYLVDSPQYPLDRKLGGPQSQSGHYGEEKNHALPGIEPGPSLYRLLISHGGNILIFSVPSS
jgi:hypothetical protein